MCTNSTNRNVDEQLTPEEIRVARGIALLGGLFGPFIYIIITMQLCPDNHRHVDDSILFIFFGFLSLLPVYWTGPWVFAAVKHQRLPQRLFRAFVSATLSMLIMEISIMFGSFIHDCYRYGNTLNFSSVWRPLEWIPVLAALGLIPALVIGLLCLLAMEQWKRRSTR